MSIERLKELFHELDCIEYKRCKLASGRYSNYKVSCDSLFKNEEARQIIGEIGYRMFMKIEGNENYEIIGVVTGGNEFAKIVAEVCGRKAISADPHTNKISGTIEKRKACYFEDTVTSGGSILKCDRLVRKQNRNIKKRKALSIAYREEDGLEKLRKNGIELSYILSKTDLGIIEH